MTSSDSLSFPQSSYADAWNGNKRTQWDPDTNHGSIFNTPFHHAYDSPYDFGLTLRMRGKQLLGEALAQSRIFSIRSEELGENECYYVKVQDSRGSLVKVWIDPAIGWRARTPCRKSN